MVKQILSKIFSSRVFYIIFALLVSIALWMYVEITEYTDEHWEVSNIQIVFKNEDVLRDRGLLISSHDPQSVTIVFETSRNTGSKLLVSGAVTVEVDLGNITSTGLANISYEISYPAGVDRNLINPVQRSVNRVSVMVDRLWEVPVPVRVSYRGGTASEELIAEAEEYDPRMITIAGPEEILSLIAYAYVPIPRENLSATFREDLSFVLFDENDEELDESLLESLTFSQDTIRVTIPIRQIKEIPLFVELAHGAGTSDSNTFLNYTPQYITISGDPEVIREINNIRLGAIDMTSFARDSNTEAFAIIVPDPIRNLSGETECIVLVEVRGLGIKYLSTDNLQVINTPPGHTATIGTRNLDVRIRGKEEDLEHVSWTNIRVVADLRDMNTGTSFLPARVFVDGVDADVGAVGGPYRLTVTLERDQE